MGTGTVTEIHIRSIPMNYPMHLFGEEIRSAILEALIEESQEKDNTHFEQLKQTHRWEKQNGQWKKEGHLAVHNDNLKREILYLGNIMITQRLVTLELHQLIFQLENGIGGQI
jgi:hypothetical protein